VDVHDLTAAYALHALDEQERAEYEAHLAHCERCRREVAELTESAAALAWAVESPPPPPALRARILGADVVPLRPRRRVWQAAAAVAACVAVGLGIWAASLNNSLQHERAHAGALAVAADPASRKVELRGRHGMIAVAPTGDAVLVVSRLAAAPSGMTYEAWVIPPGGKPQRAGTFDGGGPMTMVELDRRVPKGAVVAATMEHDGGAETPTSQPFLSAQT
jgi:anti-sigma-K factor RskA